MHALPVLFFILLFLSHVPYSIFHSLKEVLSEERRERREKLPELGEHEPQRRKRLLFLFEHVRFDALARTAKVPCGEVIDEVSDGANRFVELIARKGRRDLMYELVMSRQYPPVKRFFAVRPFDGSPVVSGIEEEER